MSPVEPPARSRRPTDVTRPQGSPDHHSFHDQVLVAAFVAGDLEGPAADTARRLVSGCDACAELATDLTALASAIRDLPSPVRTRDFRITPEQAAAIDRRGIPRLLPGIRLGLGFARPLGGGLAALGVAGLLFTSLPASQPAMILSNVGSAVGGSARAPAYAATTAPEAASTNGTDTTSKGGVAAPSAASSAAASGGAARDLASIPPVPLSTQPSPTAPAPAILPSTPLPVTGTPTPRTPAPNAAGPSQGEIPLLPAASVAALLAGLGLLGADRLARRR